ncbi:specificity protein phosphatase 26 [Seminavis robusta]|uniref:protein-serine/threonine phosphatase n=1 Tax=Seminavis robusta TaxID=568900 RepID=A0A9N8DXX7_9STRA|nr:specificity protein phosphatase 26 [Seminavis robusta]|eukprot:Sro364_g127240.1 specificity protein phosphatase 26 (253) ;mRNA; f:63339-64097
MSQDQANIPVPPTGLQTDDDPPPEPNVLDAPNIWAWYHAIGRLLETGTFREPKDLPAQVTPWMMISSEYPLRNFERLLELGVTHVLTTNAMVPELLEPAQQRYAKCGFITHGYVAGRDREGYDMLGQHWGDCLEFLSAVRGADNQKVVVHCSAGQNRSGLIVAAALIALERMTLIEAVENLKRVRGVVLINRSFRQQLCEFAAKEGLLGDKPEGFSDEPPEPIRSFEFLYPTLEQVSNEEDNQGDSREDSQR